MSITTTTQVAGPVDVVFQKTLLDNAKVMAPYFTGSEPAEIMRHSGTVSAKWRRIENLDPTTTALTALTGTESYPFREGVQPSVTDPTATLLKYGNVVSINEEVDLTNFTGMIDKLIEILGINAGQSLNRLQRNLLEDGVTMIYASQGTQDSDVADVLDNTVVEESLRVLQSNSAMKFTPQTQGSTLIGTSPIRASYWALGHVDLEHDIRALTGFVPVEKYASQTEVVPGEIGTANSTRFVISEDASVDASSGGAPGSALRSTNGTNADLYTVVVLGKAAHGSVGLDTRHVKKIYKAGDALPPVMLKQKAVGSSGAMDPLDEFGTLGWKAWWAGVILNGNWARGLRVGATKLI